VLVRSHWAARADAGPWQPAHEIRHRQEVPVAEVMAVLHMEPGLEPVYEQIWGHALHAFDL
jgi:hypothetical protein